MSLTYKLTSFNLVVINMFNKSLALLSLLFATGCVTAELRAKKSNEVINNVSHSKSKKDAADVIKNIPINVVRTLNSETCENETVDLMKNQDVMDAVANAPSGLPDYSSNSLCSIANSKVTCDYKDVFSTLETTCNNAGGQIFEYSVTMEGEGLSVLFKNLAECIGTTCDKDAALKVQEEHFSAFTALGYDEVAVKESGASSLSSALVAMIALTGVVGTLV